jgi:hypothetical protein
VGLVDGTSAGAAENSCCGLHGRPRATLISIKALSIPTIASS